MQSPSETIYFDYEANSFYKVNKFTGQSIKSYKNGEDLKYFKPNVTGFNYKARKIQLSQSKLSPLLLTRKQLKLQKQLKDDNVTKLKSKQKTNKLKFNKHLQTAVISQTDNPQTLSSSRGFIKNIQITPFKQTTTDLEEQTQITKKKSQKELFNLTLRRFGEISKLRQRQNHSVRQHIKGSQQSSENQHDKKIISLKNYSTLDPLTDSYKEQSKKEVKIGFQLKLPQYYSLKQQNMRQTSLFFKIHPEMIKKQNEQMRNRQMQRKTNMKQLEQLFIKQNQTKFSKIYSHRKSQEQ